MEDQPIQGTFVSAPLDWLPSEAPQRARVTTPLPEPPPAVIAPAVIAPTPQRGGLGRLNGLLLTGVLICGLLLGGLGGGAAIWMLTRTTAPAPAALAPPPAPQATSPSSPQVVAADSTTVGQIYKQVAGGIVDITVTVNSTGFGRFGNGGGEAEGTGIVIDPQGHILTNNHVVENSSDVRIKLLDGTELTAKVVGTAPQDDLAILQADIPADKLVVVPLGASASMQVGDAVMAIGNPFGLDHTVTTGIISAVNRDWTPSDNRRTQKGMLQTDAAINPGNSGGPLLNMQGQVVGINTAIESPSGASAGLGFAIPIDRAKTLLPQLEAGSQVQRPWIGISGGGITPRLARQYNLPVQEGILVTAVVPNSPAAKAGLKGVDITQSPTGAYGDIITAVDGQAVSDVPGLIGYLNNKNVGDTVTLSVYRDGKTISVKVTLEAWQDQTQQTQPNQPAQPNQPTQP